MNASGVTNNVSDLIVKFIFAKKIIRYICS